MKKVYMISSIYGSFMGELWGGRAFKSYYSAAKFLMNRGFCYRQNYRCWLACSGDDSPACFIKEVNVE